MKTKTSFMVGAVALTVASISAQAQVAITGQINFTGSATLDSVLPGATTLSSFVGPSDVGGPVVAAAAGLPSGSYAAVPGNTVATFAASFDFVSFSSPFELWSFTAPNTDVYSFYVNTVTTDIQLGAPAYPFGYINVGGLGTGYISGPVGNYLPTQETWSITGTTANPEGLTIVIGDSNVAVPEPTTLAFGGLGGLLSIVTLIRRK